MSLEKSIKGLSNGSCYVKVYKAKMHMRGIPEAKQLISFTRVVMVSRHSQILETQATSLSLRSVEYRIYPVSTSMQVSLDGIVVTPTGLDE
mgnify:CR=1 FL=1